MPVTFNPTISSAALYSGSPANAKSDYPEVFQEILEEAGYPIDNLPVLDLTDRPRTSNDSFCEIYRNDLTAPVMIGKDSLGKPFIAFDVICWCQPTLQQGVHVFYQREGTYREGTYLDNSQVSWKNWECKTIRFDSPGCEETQMPFALEFSPSPDCEAKSIEKAAEHMRRLLTDDLWDRVARR